MKSFVNEQDVDAPILLPKCCAPSTVCVEDYSKLLPQQILAEYI